MFCLSGSNPVAKFSPSAAERQRSRPGTGRSHMYAHVAVLPARHVPRPARPTAALTGHTSHCCKKRQARNIGATLSVSPQPRANMKLNQHAQAQHGPSHSITHALRHFAPPTYGHSQQNSKGHWSGFEGPTVFVLVFLLLLFSFEFPSGERGWRGAACHGGRAAAAAINAKARPPCLPHWCFPPFFRLGFPEIPVSPDAAFISLFYFLLLLFPGFVAAAHGWWSATGTVEEAELAPPPPHPPRHGRRGQLCRYGFYGTTRTCHMGSVRAQKSKERKKGCALNGEELLRALRVWKRAAPRPPAVCGVYGAALASPGSLGTSSSYHHHHHHHHHHRQTRT